MQRPKSQETLSQYINEVIVAGRLTNKTECVKSAKGNKVIKFVLDSKIYCVALNEFAEMINLLEKYSILLVVGKIIMLKDKNVVLVKDVELYTMQSKIDSKKVKKELKEEKRKF